MFPYSFLSDADHLRAEELIYRSELLLDAVIDGLAELLPCVLLLLHGALEWATSETAPELCARAEADLHMAYSIQL